MVFSSGGGKSEGADPSLYSLSTWQEFSHDS
jgi:hypothetical protein